MEEVWTQVLVALLNILLPIAVPFVMVGLYKLWAAVVSWFRANASEKDQRFIESVVAEGVRAVEQLWANPAVREQFLSKKGEAFKHIDARLKRAKLNISSEQVWLMIEAEVHKMKASGEEIKSPKSAPADYPASVMRVGHPTVPLNGLPESYTGQLSGLQAEYVNRVADEYRCLMCPR